MISAGLGPAHDRRACTICRRKRRETGQLLAWSLMLGVILTVLAAAYFGVIPS